MISFNVLVQIPVASYNTKSANYQSREPKFSRGGCQQTSSKGDLVYGARKRWSVPAWRRFFTTLDASCGECRVGRLNGEHGTYLADGTMVMDRVAAGRLAS